MGNPSNNMMLYAILTVVQINVFSMLFCEKFFFFFQQHIKNYFLNTQKSKLFIPCYSSEPVFSFFPPTDLMSKPFGNNDVCSHLAKWLMARPKMNHLQSGKRVNSQSCASARTLRCSVHNETHLKQQSSPPLNSGSQCGINPLGDWKERPYV